MESSMSLVSIACELGLQLRTSTTQSCKRRRARKKDLTYAGACKCARCPNQQFRMSTLFFLDHYKLRSRSGGEPCCQLCPGYSFRGNGRGNNVPMALSISERNGEDADTAHSIAVRLRRLGCISGPNNHSAPNDATKYGLNTCS